MTSDSIYKEVVNRIGNLLETVEDKKINLSELHKNDEIESNCNQDLNECLELVENLDFDSTLDNLNYTSNIDILKIKSIIEKLLNKNNNNLDNNLEIKLGNIDSRLDKLTEKIGNDDFINYNQNNLLTIKDDILNEFKEIKQKLNLVLENNNDNDDSCNSNIHELKLLMDDLNQKKDSFNSESLYNEINNLNDKLNQILDTNNIKNDNLSQKISLLNDKLSLNNNSDLYSEISNLSHKLHLFNYNNEDNISLLSKKLKEIINLIDNQNISKVKLNEDSYNNIIANTLPNKIENKLSEIEKKKLNELKENVKYLNSKNIEDNKNKISLNTNDLNGLEKYSNLNQVENNDNSSESNDLDSLENVNNLSVDKPKTIIDKQQRIKFSKNKNPFEYIYENTDGIKFKKINMDGGGRIDKLKELRKKSIKPLKKNNN